MKALLNSSYTEYGFWMSLSDWEILLKGGGGGGGHLRHPGSTALRDEGRHSNQGSISDPITAACTAHRGVPAYHGSVGVPFENTMRRGPVQHQASERLLWL